MTDRITRDSYAEPYTLASDYYRSQATAPGTRRATVTRLDDARRPGPDRRAAAPQPEPSAVEAMRRETQELYRQLETSLLDFARRMHVNPRRILGIERRLMVERLRILRGKSALTPDPHDRRFKHPIWQKNGYYRRVMQGYLAWKRALEEAVETLDVTDKDRERARFIVMQLIEAGSPTNLPWANPGFLDRAIKTRGRSLLQGLRNLADDVLTNGGMPRMVRDDAFKLGGNVAVTPGAVVHRGPMYELIQYAPSTPNVRQIPLLMIPPQINKYYIVDIAPGRSFLEHAVAQGFQVFCMSWRNPTAAQRDWGMDDYVSAAKEALDITREISGSDSVNVSGGCAGGFAAAALAGHLAQTGELNKVNSLTLLVTILDTAADTVFRLFSSDALIRLAVAHIQKRGVLDGHQTRRGFSWLRPGDLIWPYVANNYLMGNDPPAFDVLYWNSDSTRLPARFHKELCELFERNPLSQAGALSVLGTPIDLGKVDCDTYIVAGVTDHITPWKACYRGTRMFGGDVRFVLSNSGHIQSLVNPPGNPKANYFTSGKNTGYRLDPDLWREQAQQHSGSWWVNWGDWMLRQSGGERAAPASLGSRSHRPIDAAPGMYVHRH